MRERIRLKSHRLAAELAERSLSQNAWAGRLGLSKGYLSHLKTGRRKYPSAAVRRKLLEVLGLEFDDLFEVEGPRSEDKLDVPRRSGLPNVEHHGSRGDARMELVRQATDFAQDLRFALRTLFKSKVVAVAAIASLALVVAGNTVVFSVVNSLLIRPLDFDPEARLMLAWRTGDASTFDRRLLSPADFNDYRKRNTVFEDMAAYTAAPRHLTGLGRPEEVLAAGVSPAFFRLVEVPVVHGRSFTDEEGLPGGAKVAILSRALFERRFGGDEAVLGQTVEIDRRPHRIVGVLGEGFEFIEHEVEMWLAFQVDSASGDREAAEIFAVGKLRAGVTPKQARSDLRSISTELARHHPEVNRGIRLEAVSFREVLPGRDNETVFKLLQGAGIFLLLIACGNLASLLLARGQARRKELAMRCAIGAGRFRIVRQLVTESLMLGLAGGALGTGLGLLGVNVVKKAMVHDVPRLYLPVVDHRVILFSLVLSVAAGITFGTLPALRSTGGALLDSLKEGGAPGSPARGWIGKVPVVGQVCLALVLLCGVALMLKSFSEVRSTDSGFDDRRLLTFQLTLPEEGYETPAQVYAFLDSFLPELRAVPGVEDAAVTSALPRTYQNPRIEVELPGQVYVEGRPNRQVTWLAVMPGYFESMSIPVLRGRSLGLADQADSGRVAVVDQRIADLLWPGEDPLGRRIVLRGEERTVVGVARNVTQRRLGELDGPVGAVVYLPWSQETVRTARFMVRSRRGDPMLLAEAVRSAVWRLDPDLPLAQIATFDDVMASSYVVLKVIGRLIAGFGIFALLLAALGVYGVLAYSVSQRTREIGVRLAMGSTRGRVVGMVLREGVAVAALGLVLGLPVVFGVRQVLESVLTGLTSGWLVFVPLVAAGLLAVIVAASWVPARRAAALSPVAALRGEQGS